MQQNDKSNIKISIITISKYDYQGLKNTVRSVQSQTYTEYENIIVVKHPSSKTLSFLSNQNDQRIQIIIQTQEGIYNAMNLGLSKISGNLIIFLNSGDVFVSDSILYDIQETYKKINFLWATGSYFINFDEYYIEFKIANAPNLHDLFFKRVKISHQATVYTKHLIDKLSKFNENYKISGDFEFNLRASLISAPQILKFFISNVQAGGISQKKVFRSSYEDFKVRMSLNRLGFWYSSISIFIFLRNVLELSLSQIIKKTLPSLHEKLKRKFL